MFKFKVRGNVIRTADGKILNYAKDDIVFSSAKKVDTDAPEVLYGIAEPHPQKEIPLAIACVEFIPVELPDIISPIIPEKKMKYKGEFGFDFFRKKNSKYRLEEPFFDALNDFTNNDNSKDTIENNSIDQYHISRKEQYESLCKEYDKLPITYRTKKEINEGWESEEWTYYIPYLTLYSQEYVDRLTVENKPSYVAYLSMIVEIEKNLDEWKFEYDKDIFNLSLEFPLDKEKCPPTRHSTNLKITCLKDFDREMEIKVFAYPKVSTKISELEKENMKELAGIIKVLPNSEIYRKNMKVFVVQIRTDIMGNGVIQEGIFNRNEIEKFHYIFNQAYIEPEIEFYKANNGDEYLDLTKDINLKTGSKFINSSGCMDVSDQERMELQNYLEKFIPENKKDSIILYFFGIENVDNTILGTTILDSKRSFIYFSELSNFGIDIIDINIKSCSTECPAHEALHSLGLEHTFSIPGKDTKYFFIQSTTCNVMDFVPESYYLYKWQWDRIRKKI